MDDFSSRLPTTMLTERLELATPVPWHVPDMARLANNRRIFDVLSRLPHPYAESDGRLFVENIARSAGEFSWSVLCDGRFIGVVGLSLVLREPPALGYWLGEPFWGQGYATEAAKAVVDAARAAGCAALRSRARTCNHASRNVLRKIGFTEVAEGPAPDGSHAGEPTTFMLLEFS